MSLTQAATVKLAERMTDQWVWPLGAQVIYDDSGVVVAIRNEDGSWSLTDAGCWQVQTKLCRLIYLEPPMADCKDWLAGARSNEYESYTETSKPNAEQALSWAIIEMYKER